MHNKINHKTDLNDDLDQIRLKARETREAISQAAHDVKQRANEAFQQSFKDAKEKSGEMQDSVVAYVKDNPVRAIGIAAIAGFILAKLIHK